MALGDVDGDGDLDLVCGNYGQSTTLYRNVGTTFESVPCWESGRQDFTRSVALGDVDGDGDLDLVCGNELVFQSTSDPPGWRINPTTLYLNLGTVFETSPSWESRVETDCTSSVALGDVDGDGDLDLVCGNRGNQGPSPFGQTTKLYRNLGTTFEAVPSWESGPREYSNSVALGDVDGDGDLDLVSGNSGPGLSITSKVYLNLGTTFEISPSWFWQRALENVALGDVDEDGDLDLVCFGSSTRGPGVYLFHNVRTDGTGSLFETTPSWSSGRQDANSSVALGDIDGDGDLDLVCGNQCCNQSTTLYRNLAAAFRNNWPAWSAWSHPLDFTWDVVLGDVDGDHDLDLVCGNGGSSTRLYRNVGMTFEGFPFWSSGQRDPTHSVVLGDVDGDGDLDLVCGNEGSTTLYLNLGTTFETTPSWSSGQQARSVALGDVDRDGDLDLVSVFPGRGATLYRNLGTTFETTSSWSSGQQGTLSVALGDVDGDGDLDLVCGNNYQSTTLYLNLGATFEKSPSWSSGRQDNTWSVALGDVDDDGDLDLVCGNYNESTALYLNLGTTFQTTPSWSSERQDPNTHIALGDVDGDGDLDLVCSNFYGRATLYLNVGSTFETAPAWLGHEQQDATSVALGDIDGDGDLDSVYGSDYGGMTVFWGQARPPFHGDPLHPTNQLPNNSAYLRRVLIDENGTNRYRVRLTAVDLESDSVLVMADYAFRGSAEWKPIRMVGGGNRVGPLDSSPAGVEHSFDWDVVMLPAGRWPVEVRLRTISNPRRAGVIRDVAGYVGEAGLQVRHPTIATSVTGLELPAITVGDTVAADFVVRNDGNEVLTVTDVALPSPSMQLDRTIPFEVAPSSSIPLSLSFHPVVPDSQVSGRIEFHSNDPITPSLEIGVAADARGLDFSTRPVMTGSDSLISLGTPLTVLVVPAPRVRIEKATLFHRPRLSSGDFRSIPFAHPGQDFVCVIPGTDIDENGLEFYVEAENSGIRRTDPPGAPDSLFAPPLQLPARVFANPRPPGSQGFLQGRSIDVQVTMPSGLLFQGGLLHYREAGRLDYEQDSLRVVGPSLLGTIPDSSVGARGVEYWVEVQSATLALRDPPPPRDASSAPLRLRTTVSNVEEPLVHSGLQYRMVTFPLEFGASFVGTLQTLLSDEAEFGPYDPIRWRAFRYVDGGNVELSQGSDDFRPEPGRAFWLVSRESHRLDTRPIAGLSVPSDSAFVITLPPQSWNQIGNPFAFPVAWSDSVCPSCEPPKAYVPTNPAAPYRTASVLEPFEGYFIYNTSPTPAALRIQPVESAVAHVLTADQTETTRESWLYASDQNNSNPHDHWALRVEARTAHAADQANLIGVHVDASEERDVFDEREIPAAPGTWVQLSFPHPEWAARPGTYQRDIRAAGSSGHSWDVEIRTDGPGEQVELGVLPETTLPGDLVVRLVDRELGASDDLTIMRSKQDRLDYRLLSLGRQRPYRLTILAGTEDYVSHQAEQLALTPSRTVLDPSSPNPFSGMTRIRFGLPRTEPVSLDIYNVRGERVASLLRGAPMPAGFHAVLWAGTNDAGHRLPSGVYFLCLRAGSLTFTKRSILVK